MRRHKSSQSTIHTKRYWTWTGTGHANVILYATQDKGYACKSSKGVEGRDKIIWALIQKYLHNRQRRKRGRRRWDQGFNPASTSRGRKKKKKWEQKRERSSHRFVYQTGCKVYVITFSF